MQSKLGIHQDEDLDHPLHFDLSFRTWSRSKAFDDTLTVDQLDAIWAPLTQALYLQLRAQIREEETKKIKVLAGTSKELLKDEIPF